LFEINVIAPLRLMQLALPRLNDGARLINVTSDAGTEPYPGWGGYGASKAALEQLTSVFAVEHPEYVVHSVDPGDMRTVMHQDAFPGEDISDRPLPEEIVPQIVSLIEGGLPSGRYRAAELEATRA
jgi:NAD(P)-dependent dehydrogenase (short-subunit alcohol dehydrogenase family)